MNTVQKFIVKEAEGLFGKDPNERTVQELINSGIVNIDKPKGPSSHQVSDYVQKILGIKKAGHSGTLDPAVTGVQPIALSDATRITQFFLTAPKEYVGIMHLHQKISVDKIKVVMEKFTGKITQLPPIKSAVKRQERVREIYEFEIIEIDGQDVLFRVKCQAGTYIRKLCHDIGKELDIGAHMAELRRTAAGPLTEKDNLITLNDLKDAIHYWKENGNEKYVRYCIQPIENVLHHIRKVWVFDSAIESLSNGRDLGVPGVSIMENFRKDEYIAIMSLKGELVAIGESQMSAVECNIKKKGLAVKVKKVFVKLNKKT
ncbi:RNA-guided pseudouridylation complex pseudouridine synthase subunit Cbf5 [archaeon]|jgi:H/ACA ribonucleoprotein complex subunit 4|nr:RNA-guided pseudouridylation complex pseudouridine synthase subunit Cbf5 [archaeon]MBT3450951.1 RNA-guided pseudouridylation complex pseudouridine synthase subunit Cbf5 [archaeon]MBT6869474.1 RNA-guided pseudouridylation complex pseudouridine synthase subunit Cbf5 [archaeon]MBT7193162.1 RNA-guided pseudouridylation complex pseudouridine synthase subunit Cbf5 [archaeon]MBT7380468.1 RNA-guided pseudouridylation complex pseudouridine synthase subunit Cbf5 [archaeon]